MHQSTRDLPRGSISRDRNGDHLITWPDGQYGYDLGHRHAYPSHSTGPYEPVIDGFTERECDAFARLDPAARSSVVTAYEALLGLSSSVAGSCAASARRSSPDTQRPAAGLVRGGEKR